MRSIPYVMAWELVRRGRWQMLLAALGANLMPFLLLTALRMEGPLDPNDLAMITMQMILIIFQPAVFAAALFSAIDSTPRSYTLPVPTATLVAWKMIPAMVLMFLESAISIAAVNLFYQLNWPIWGPSLLSSVTVAMVIASVWFSERTIFLPFCVAIAGGISGLWYKSRWGAIFAVPTHVWVSVTPLEIATMALLVGASYWIAVIGVSRNRRGETLSSEGTWVWLDRILNWTFDFRADRAVRFATPQEAHYWAEWTKKGLLLPGIVVFYLVVAFGGWLIFSRNPSDMIDGLIGGGAMLLALGMVGGLAIGNTGRPDSDFEMGSFLATRPLTNRDFAKITLDVIAKSVVFSWAIWAVAFGLVIAIQWATGDLAKSPDLQRLSWWYVPGTLVGAWITNAAVGSLSLTGHSSSWVKVTCAVFAVVVGVSLASKLLDKPSQAWLINGMMVVMGIGFAAISIFLIKAAHRRALIASQTTMLAVIGWVVLAAVITIESFRSSAVTPAVAILLVGIASLAVSPLAAAPLAVTWNRHR